MPLRKVSLPEHVDDAMKNIEEYTGFNVPKTTARTAASVYKAAMYAAAVALPLTVGGTTTLSQEPIRRLDDHIASQLYAPKTLQELAAYQTSAGSTDRSVKLTGQAIMASGGRLIGQLDVKSIN